MHFGSFRVPMPQGTFFMEGKQLRMVHYRTERAQEAGESPYKFLNSDTITDQSLSPLDKVVDVSASRKVQARNHAYMRALVSNHALSESRLGFDSEFRLDGQYSSKNLDNMEFKNGKSAEITTSEGSRIIGTLYTAAALELRQYAFVYEEFPTARLSIPFIDFMPILNLSFRELLKLYVVLQVLFVEATPVEMRA